MIFKIIIFFQINEALSADGKLSKIDNIDRDRLQLLIKFWAPFKKDSDKLEGEDYPTLPLACLTIGILRKHCSTPLQLSRWM